MASRGSDPAGLLLAVFMVAAVFVAVFMFVTWLKGLW